MKSGQRRVRGHVLGSERGLLESPPRRCLKVLGPKFKHPWKGPWSEVTLGPVNQGQEGRVKSHKIAADFVVAVWGR